MLIYCQHISPRIEYTFNVIFTVLCKAKYRITTNSQEFLTQEGSKINYSTEPLNVGLKLPPDDIMFGNSLQEVDVKAGNYQGKAVLFTHTQETELPYDPIAAIFYMISRYEEYLPHDTDEHGRFKFASSCAFKLGFYDKAMVHYWFEDLINSLKKSWPSFEVIENQYLFVPTFDIDNAFAYLNKGWIRTAAAFAKSMLTNFREIPLRLNVLKGREEDPYDNYDYIDSINATYDKKGIFFILTACKGTYDRNIEPKSEAFKALVKELKRNGKVGIHPSYASNAAPMALKKEKDILCNILKSEVKYSRQHFLKLRFPETYESLLDNGISDDFTMGFAEKPGFRAGIARPYPFYNLRTETMTSLVIHPFSFMESTFMYYSQTSLEEVKIEMAKTINEVRKVNGQFIPIWHNESLGEKGKWTGWREVFEFMYQEATAS